MSTIFQLTVGQILLGSSLLAILLGAIQWLLANWMKIRLEQSIRHEYDKKLEDYRFAHLQRQKAEVIATFFAKWIKYRGNEKCFLNDKEMIDHYEELNRMSLEVSLWIEDKDVLDEIMSVTQLKGGNGNVREITGKVRKLILNIVDDDFDPKEVTLWPNQEETIKLFRLDKKG